MMNRNFILLLMLKLKSGGWGRGIAVSLPFWSRILHSNFAFERLRSGCGVGVGVVVLVCCGMRAA